MRFNSDGKFKIMQITDIQEIPDVSPDTIKLINAALEEEKPDLVVLTGDQIKGYGVSYKGKGDALIDCRQALKARDRQAHPVRRHFRQPRQAGRDKQQRPV